jgi:hypothetical protein
MGGAELRGIRTARWKYIRAPRPELYDLPPRRRVISRKAAQLDAAHQLNLARLYKMARDKARARAAFEAFLAAKGASPEYRQVVPQVREELAAVQ